MNSRSKLLAVAVPLAVVLGALVVADYGYVRVHREVAAQQELAEAQAQTLAKYLGMIADKPRYEAKLAALKEARAAEAAKMIEGQTPSVAAASLQNAVKQLITARGGTISSERVEKPEDLDKFRVINVALEAVLPDVRALAETLFAIESQTPYLVIQELEARGINYRDPKDPREITVRLTVAGLMGGR